MGRPNRGSGSNGPKRPVNGGTNDGSQYSTGGRTKTTKTNTKTTKK